MYKQDIEYIQQLESNLDDNRYSAVLHIIDAAHNIQDVYSGISNKSAINAVICKSHLDTHHLDSHQQSSIDRILEYELAHLHDEALFSSVVASVYRSLSYQYVFFDYQEIDPIYYPRIKILTRKILDHIKKYKGGDYSWQ